MSVRVRYAPSPTGSPHVGNIRDALFKHLFAKRYQGVHIVRIEDTDRTRLVEGCVDEIMESLRWMNIEWQEGPDKGGSVGPYVQSERQAAGIYDEWIKVLLEKGAAYKAFDSSEELTEMREFQQINKQPVGYYGGVWRDASPEKVAEAEKTTKPVIRLKIPRNQTIVIEDVIRGRIEWDSNTVDDPVLIKADGMPTYHFAAMVDDHLMGITHIIRGEEWISSAPKHAVLFDAFGWERPVFVHCPVIKGKDGSKLSKRHGDTRCLDFRSAGYLPSALANFIALIGWSPGGDREILPMPELEAAFDLEGIQPSPGVFDMDKLKWMNGNYIRALSLDELYETVKAFALHPETTEYWSREAHSEDTAAQYLPLLKKIFGSVGIAGPDPHSPSDLARQEYVKAALALEQKRVHTLADFGEATAFFFQDEPPFDPKAIEKWFGQEHVPALLKAMIEWCQTTNDFSVEACEKAVRDYAAANNLDKLGPVVHPIRVALTGKTAGPGLFELMNVLGPERMLKRFKRAEGQLTRSAV